MKQILEQWELFQNNLESTSANISQISKEQKNLTWLKKLGKRDATSLKMKEVCNHFDNLLNYFEKVNKTP